MDWDGELYREVNLVFESGDLDQFRDTIQQHPRYLRKEDGGDVWMSDAAAHGHLPMVQLLVELGMDVNETQYTPNHRSFRPEGAIQRAASKGHVEVVRWMLEHGAKITFDLKGQRRCMPLVSTATFGHLEVVKLLVEHGADLQARSGGV